MSDDWIKKAADRLKEKDRKEADASHRKQHLSQLIAGSGGEFVELVFKAIRRQVAVFNEEFPDDPPKRIEIEESSPTSINVTRKDIGEQARVLKIHGLPQGLSSQLIVTDYTSGQPRQQVYDEGMRFHLSADDRLGLATAGAGGGVRASVEDVASDLLRKLF